MAKAESGRDRAPRPRDVLRAPLPWQTIQGTLADDHARSHGEIDRIGAHGKHCTDDRYSARTELLLDADLALLYGVPTKRLNEQVRRNANRFPADFMFQLTDHEVTALRSQIATSKPRRGGRRYLPYAFTEHGAIMA